MPPEKEPLRRPTSPLARACPKNLPRMPSRTKAVGGDKVRMTFWVILRRQQAEALAARAIREEKNIVALVAEILEAAGVKGRE